MYNNYTIAFCDILGFSPLVEQQPLQSIVNNALGLFTRCLHHAVHQGDFSEYVPSLKAIRDQAHIGVARFSDSVLLYTRQDTDESVQQLLSAVGWLLFETITATYTRVRCGISYGQAYMDQENSLFVGRPIIEAYELEGLQLWAGAALTPAAVERLPQGVRSGKYGDWWVLPYRVPMKEPPGFRETLAVNWTAIGVHDPEFQLGWSPATDIPTGEDWIKNPDVCRIFENTRAFHESACWCRRSANQRV